MSEHRYVLVVDGLYRCADNFIIDNPSMTAPLEIGPAMIDIRIQPREPFVGFEELRREPKKRDWEQRHRKHRRRP